MKEKLQEKLLAAIDDVLTAKFFILITATILTLTKRLDQQNWVMVMLTMAGLREAVNITGMIKSPGSAAKASAAAAKKADDDAQ
jgi:hypothetical protein